ncbi:alpha/beta hydrolase [Methanobrevibacter sp.]|uniref:alpha/beta hydrolase n=1 Tax=Methanobrevibacter sp. TaxID=66852 RepID=UPI0025DEB401|nr:alpha/beta hydrolase [Methanobrevibacter sp.]MBQ2962997.1 alpha/beta hydrolase [Methanobrevibacter sp.]
MSDKKSFIARIEESILRFTKPSYMDFEKDIHDFLMQRAEITDAEAKVPFFKSRDWNGIQVFGFGDESSKIKVLFIHGGAYLNEINLQHLLYCRMLARQLGAYVIAPVYPLAPNHSYAETFDIVTKLYGHLLEEKEKTTDKSNISLMGDSAGGGFVLSFCQYLKEISLEQPDNIVVFSPWVDISMSNCPYESEDDPILGEVGLREIGKEWAGDLDTKDYKVSPIYGDSEGLPRTLIFTGENEIFYKDIKLFYENLIDCGVDARLVVGKGLFHIYPMFPIPEARDALKEIKKEFKK